MVPLSIFNDCLFSAIFCYGTAATERKPAKFVQPLEVRNELFNSYSWLNVKWIISITSCMCANLASIILADERTARVSPLRPLLECTTFSFNPIVWSVSLERNWVFTFIYMHIRLIETHLLCIHFGVYSIYSYFWVNARYNKTGQCLALSNMLNTRVFLIHFRK